MKIDLQIITPEKVAYQGEADAVSVPTQQGEITILPKHMSLVSTMKHGALVIKNEGKETVLAVYKGFVEIRKNQVLIMTDIAERVDEIDAEKAEQARQEAQRRLLEKDKMDDIAFADTVAVLEKSLARLKATRRKHGH
jgi:F-type H+-transporting ATPase subunit epsilon